MLRLSYSPTIGTTIPLTLNFKDSYGRQYVPAKISYSFLALKNDLNTWQIVDDIFDKEVSPKSVVHIGILSKSNINVEGCTLRRQIRIKWVAYLEDFTSEFEEIVEFEVNPQPIIDNKPAEPALPPPKVLDNPKVGVVVINVEGEYEYLLKLEYNFPVDYTKIEEDTFKIDGDPIKPEIDSSCRILTFNISGLSSGTHTIESAPVESIFVGATEAFEKNFAISTSGSNNIFLYEEDKESVSGDCLTVSEALIDIVTNVKGLEEQIDTINNSISELQAKDAELENKIPADLGTITQDIIDLKAAVQAINANIITLRDELTSLTNQFVPIEQNLNDLNTNMDTVRIDLNDLQTEVGNVKDDVNTATTDIGNLQNSVGDLQTDVSQLQTDVSQLQTDVIDLTGRVEILENTP